MNRIAKAFGLSLVALLALTLPASAQANVAGNWTLNVESPEGPATINAEFAQDGATVTGKIEVESYGTFEVSDGTIDESTLEFLLHMDFEGQYFVIEVEAAVEGDSMEGSFFVAEFGSMPFSGKRADG